MTEHVRNILCQLIQQHGRSLAGDIRRCEGLLRDHCPNDKREVHLLVNALREGVPAELGDAAPLAAIERLRRKLEQNLGLAPEAARWAVESWALALGIQPLQPDSPTHPSPELRQEANTRESPQAAHLTEKGNFPGVAEPARPQALVRKGRSRPIVVKVPRWWGFSFMAIGIGLITPFLVARHFQLAGWWNLFLIPALLGVIGVLKGMQIALTGTDSQ